MDFLLYFYSKKRKTFGRQVMFCEAPVQMIDSIDPNEALQKKFVLLDPVDQSVQATQNQSEKYINTRRVFKTEQGINHTEGGWPKEVNHLDEDVTLRYRRRVERDDDYVHSVLHAYPKFVHYIKQNNAIDMYDLYFKGMKPESEVEKTSIVLKNKYRDTLCRPISCVTWTTEEDTKLVVTYCDPKYPIPSENTHADDVSCSVWNLENPNDPFVTFQPPSACWKAVCSPSNPNILLTGLADGRVCIFDLRDHTSGYEPAAISPIHLAHRDPVNALVFIISRLNTEFFSGSTDGQCLWWDIRNISMPMDQMIMSVRNSPGQLSDLSNSEPVRCLQFERSIPTRFLCGTDTGLVINVNRKGKTQAEIMSAVFHTHSGPVKAVHRSPLTTKMFMTCGDWRVRIWSDDILTSPIIPGKPQRHQLNDAAWAPQRISSYMCITANGILQYWDLLRKIHEPVITYKIANIPLLKLSPHEEGRFVAIGDKSGVTHLLQLSDSLVFPGEKDKQLMLQVYDRESRRERILESRVKEIRLKLKSEEEPEEVEEEAVDEEALVKAAEEAYRKAVLEELRASSGVTSERPNQNSKSRQR